MNKLLVYLWKTFAGSWQWYALWLAHNKFVIGVSGVIFNEQQQVLLLRHRFWAEGSWGLPGGYANRGETLENTLIREIKEETGYLVEVTQLLQVESGRKLRIGVVYRGHLLGGHLSLDPREVIEAKFFSTEALPSGIVDSARRLIVVATALPQQP